MATKKIIAATFALGLFLSLTGNAMPARAQLEADCAQLYLRDNNNQRFTATSTTLSTARTLTVVALFKCASDNQMRITHEIDGKSSIIMGPYNRSQELRTMAVSGIITQPGTHRFQMYVNHIDQADPNFGKGWTPHEAKFINLTVIADASGTPPTLPPNRNGTTNNNNNKNTSPSVDESLCDPSYNTTEHGLCIPNNPFTGTTGLAGSKSLTEFIAKVINILLYFAGIIAVVFVIYGGYQYMTAGGSEEQAGSGRKTMTNAIIGLVIVILAYVIITAVTSFILA